jgi:hypothetical protein
MAAWLRIVRAGCAALALFACEPAAPADPPDTTAAATAPDSVVDELPPSAQKRIAPVLAAGPPAREAPTKPPAKPRKPAEAMRPTAAPTAAVAAVAAAKATTEDAEHPPLEILLKQPPSAPPEPSSTIDLSPDAPDPVSSASRDRGALDGLKDRVRLERRTDTIGPAGPRQGTVSETEAALKIPVDESVSLEGGVRVDSREEPSAKEPVRRSTPQVGVEVRF